MGGARTNWFVRVGGQGRPEEAGSMHPVNGGMDNLFVRARDDGRQRKAVDAIRRNLWQDG